ncbi:carbohydrate-binding protein [Metarhizium guizhouense ARSEF 977]|uniref:Carbohydrate-binding protein n=1 Tax=Metarhizium guizhouense (strain ARSEF 977) TaxID=1276136 RepID=A0A0B4G7E3_METGA|nr:carbohydrate-binding protein [Metarhizium guizhouense ARSEF 977]
MYQTTPTTTSVADSVAAKRAAGEEEGNAGNHVAGVAEPDSSALVAPRWQKIHASPVIIGKPSIVSFPDGSCRLFFRRTDNHVYEFTSTTTGDWTPTTGPTRVIRPGETDIECAGNVAVHGFTRSDFHIFVRGANNVVYHKMYQTSHGGWANWAPLSGVLALSDVAVHGAGTSLYVAVRTVNNLVAVKERRDGVWRDWETAHVGGQILGTPAIFKQDNSTNLHLFVRGLDNFVYTKVQTRGVWQREWTPLAGRTVSNPVVAPRLDKWGVYIVGTDNAVHQKWWDGSTWKPSQAGGWQEREGAVAAPEDLQVVVRNDGDLRNPRWREELFAQWTDNSVRQRSWNSVDGWHAWKSLGGVIAEGLAVAKEYVQEPRVVVRGSDGILWERR